jgi:hypothetical protein
MHAMKAYGASLGKEHPFPTDCVAEWAQSQYGHCGGWRGKDKSLALLGIKTTTN